MLKSITFFCLCLAIGIVSLSSAQPTVHYTFTEMSGTSLIDHSGNNNHGQINGASWQQSSGLRGLSFNGSIGLRMECYQIVLVLIQQSI